MPIVRRCGTRQTRVGLLPLVALTAWAAGTPARAQERPILPSTGVVQAGRASLYPMVSLQDVGTDSNVFRTPEAPVADFTWTLASTLFAVVPLGGGEFTGTGEGDFIYYETYADQRSLDGGFEGRYDVVDARFRPFALAGIGSYRRQDSLEIDQRVRQDRYALAAGAEVDLTGLTALAGWIRREGARWDPDAVYEGENLSQELDHVSTIVAGGARFQITPLTSVLAAVEIQQDRFEFSPERDNDSYRIAPAVRIETGGAIAGRAQVGYRRFTPVDAALAGFGGVVASAALALTVPDLTEVLVEAGRDLEYSYDPLQPYYLESGVGVQLTQHIAGPFEAIVTAERWRARYQRYGSGELDGRVERTTILGGGVAIRAGDRVKVTVTADRIRRTSSEAAVRDYERERFMGAVHYGL